MNNVNHRYEAEADFRVVMYDDGISARWELVVRVRRAERHLRTVHVAGDLDAETEVNPIPDIYERERLLETVGFVSALDPDYPHDEDGQGWRWWEESALMGVPDGVIDLHATLPVVPINEYAERGASLLAEEIHKSA